MFCIKEPTLPVYLGREDVFERFFGILYHFFRQYSIAGAAVLAGLYLHGGKNKPLLYFTGLLVAADICYPLFLNDVSLDITTFAIPSIIILGVWAGFGFSELFKELKKRDI